MNIYRISYTTSDAETGTANITERSETAARKAFKASCKAIGRTIPDITDIELIGEGAGATKQQERDTLAAIIQMVEELGPESYLKTAFEGCFEDAEQNIEDDAAYSMKGRYERCLQEALDAEERIRSLEEQLASIKSEYAGLAEKTDRQLETLRQKVLAPDDLTDVSQLLSSKVLDLGKEVSNAAARIVEAAGQPESAAFQNAVKDHRAASADLEHYTALLVRVNNTAATGA